MFQPLKPLVERVLWDTGRAIGGTVVGLGIFALGKTVADRMALQTPPQNVVPPSPPTLKPQ